MKKGYLSDYFESVAAKRLSAVEADGLKSNQHEFNGIADFKAMFGTQKKSFDAHFVYLGENDDDFLSDDGMLTWYDARERHATRTEYRLYYQSVEIFERVFKDDLLIICKIDSENVFVIVAEEGSTKENQLCWLFNLDENKVNKRLDYKLFEKTESTKLTLISNCILEEIGIDANDSFIEETYLELITKNFPNGLPSTKVFSRFARDNCGNLDPTSSPDSVLLQWMEFEEVLFRTFEKYIIEDKLRIGFEDVDSFIAFSLSVHNRRKSRAGYAFENHLHEIFSVHNIQFSYNKKTELKSRPDFIFPSIEEYRNSNFPSSNLYMLAVKTSCKDRWRQILSEAKRVKTKHLITLEPGISIDQTSEMASKDVQLIIPEDLHVTYTSDQQGYIISLYDFLKLVGS